MPRRPWVSRSHRPRDPKGQDIKNTNWPFNVNGLSMIQTLIIYYLLLHLGSMQPPIYLKLISLGGIPFTCAIIVRRAS